jgi:ribosomal protein S14
MYFKKIFNDKCRRASFEKVEIRYRVIKTMFKSKTINEIFVDDVKSQIGFYDKNSFSSKINNSCVFTGRGNGVHRMFRVSRIILRRSAAENNIYGLRKSSW